MLPEFKTFDDFETLCAESFAEGLTLEFKQKEDATTAQIGRSDKKQIAEAVSSFANSEGGVLLYGVRSEKRGGSDVAVELRPPAAQADAQAAFPALLDGLTDLAAD